MLYVVVFMGLLIYRYESPRNLTPVDPMKYSKELILDDEIFTIGFMSGAAYSDNISKLYFQLIEQHYSGINFFSNDRGFSAITFKRKLKINGKERIAIAFPGTENFYGYFSDFWLPFSLIPSQYKAAESYCRETINDNPNSEIFAVGHSLGGGMANYCAIKFPQRIRSISFNPAPIPISLLKETNNSSKPEIVNMIATSDCISRFGRRLGKTFYYDVQNESGKVIYSHDFQCLFRPFQGHDLYKTTVSLPSIFSEKKNAHLYIEN